MGLWLQNEHFTQLGVWCFLCGAMGGRAPSSPADLPDAGVPQQQEAASKSWWQSLTGWSLSACWQSWAAEPAPNYIENVANENLAFGVVCVCVCLFRQRLLQLLLLPCIKHALDESKNLIQNICVSPGSPYSPVYLTSIDASGLIPKLVFCTNWVSLSSSLQNQESQRWVYWKSHLCWRKISLFLHFLKEYFSRNSSFVFLSISSFCRGPGR